MYLTPELKSYYQTELQKCNETKDPSWKLDKGLLSILTNINKNPNIQTILSKRPSTIIYGNDYSAKSYLYITFTEKIKTKLINDLNNKLIVKFKNDDVQVFLLEDEKLELNENQKEEQKSAFKDPNLCKIEAITNPEKYFDVNYIQINLYDDSMKKHKEFWTYLENFLTKI